MTTTNTIDAYTITTKDAYDAAVREWDIARAAMPEAAALNRAADKYDAVAFGCDTQAKAAARRRMDKATYAYIAAGQRLPQWRVVQDAWIKYMDSIAD